MKSSRTDILTREIVKSVIKIEENERIRNKWENKPYNIFGVLQTTPVFLI